MRILSRLEHDRCIVRYRWRKPGGIVAGGLFFLILTMLLVLFGWPSVENPFQYAPDGIEFWFAGAWVIMMGVLSVLALIVAYLTVLTAVNTTTFHLTVNELRVTHRPLPWFASKLLLHEIQSFSSQAVHNPVSGREDLPQATFRYYIIAEAVGGEQHRVLAVGGPEDATEIAKHLNEGLAQIRSQLLIGDMPSA